jgi:CHAT domain-containing protein
LYNLLFPKEIQELATTENLVIIPDGKLAIVPFEVLHSENYTTKLTDENEVQYFAQMPYLIKKHNISYSYSAGLFNNSLKNETKAKQNDWIAFAPVFDNQQVAGTTLQTKKLLTTTTDTLQTRTLLADGSYISPLPGSKVEIENIFQLFSKKNKKAVIKTHQQADENFVKSDEMQNYRIIHFATHGFVNQENPKLSGILFAQDTTTNKNSGFVADNLAQNEGILYQSELYNCKFNADLTVLSACETGLGKITKGEGVVGLTQALLYAGSNNILVSLWQVSDASTKDLMISFYTNLLKTKTASKYGNFLRTSKLEMLAKSNYTHPYYWSPFILIGE